MRRVHRDTHACVQAGSLEIPAHEQLCMCVFLQMQMNSLKHAERERAEIEKGT